jgi:DNA polymerase V
MRVSFYADHVPAGFPSPADSHIESQLDLNDFLIRHPSATFFVRVAGDSMTGAGIHSGDILIVDRSLAPVDKKIVIAIVNGELTVKRLRRANDQLWLVPENSSHPPLLMNDDSELEIWGVVTTVLHPV